MNSILNFSPEVLEGILLYLPVKSMICVSNTCKFLYEFCRDKTFCRRWIEGQCFSIDTYHILWSKTFRAKGVGLELQTILNNPQTRETLALDFWYQMSNEKLECVWLYLTWLEYDQHFWYKWVYAKDGGLCYSSPNLSRRLIAILSRYISYEEVCKIYVLHHLNPKGVFCDLLDEIPFEKDWSYIVKNMRIDVLQNVKLCFALFPSIYRCYVTCTMVGVLNFQSLSSVKNRLEKRAKFVFISIDDSTVYMNFTIDVLNASCAFEFKNFYLSQILEYLDTGRLESIL